MADNELNTINITIAGRIFPVKVTEEEKDDVTQLAGELNNKIAEFQRMYANRDKLDSVIMTMLTYIYDLRHNKNEDMTQEAQVKVNGIIELLKDF